MLYTMASKPPCHEVTELLYEIRRQPNKLNPYNVCIINS